MRNSYIAPWPSLVNKRSEVYRANGSSTHSPAKPQIRVCVPPRVFKAELITASKAALHIPLNAPAMMLSSTTFRECRAKKAKIFIGGSDLCQSYFLRIEIDCLNFVWFVSARIGIDHRCNKSWGDERALMLPPEPRERARLRSCR